MCLKLHIFQHLNHTYIIDSVLHYARKKKTKQKKTSIFFLIMIITAPLYFLELQLTNFKGKQIQLEWCFRQSSNKSNGETFLVTKDC